MVRAEKVPPKREAGLHRQDETRRTIVCRINLGIAILFLVPLFASCSGCSALFDVAPRIEAELEALRNITETDIIGTWIAEYDLSLIHI